MPRPDPHSVVAPVNRTWAGARAAIAGAGAGRYHRVRSGTNAPRLLDLIAMDEAAWDELSRGSAIRRARRAGFLRNVAVALGNWGSPDAVPALVRALDDPEPLVRGHAPWALGQTGVAEVRAELKARLQLKRDGWVREEIAAALDGPAA